MRARLLRSVTVLAFALAPACSGAASSELLSPGGPATSGGSDAAVDTFTQSVNDSGTQADTQASVDSGGGIQDVTVVDVVAETGGGSTIFCGSASCSQPEFCCVTGAGQGGNPKYKCDPAGSTCTASGNPGTPVHCDKTADCASGQVCCGTNLNGFYSEVSCSPTCAGQSGGGFQVQFCDPNGNDCPQGMMCQPSQVLTGYSVCN